MVDVVVLVPYQPSDEYRRAAWARAADHLGQLGWAVAVGESVPPFGWRKGAALADAASYAPRAAVYVVHDADTMIAHEALRACVAACLEGASWAMPHDWVHRLNRAATAEVVARRVMPAGVSDGARDRIPYRGIAGGGITVVRADVWQACPIDRRFVGWGGEDEAFGWALATLYGQPWRPPGGDLRLWHLWHPHPAPRQRFPPDPASRRLLQAYRNARGIPRIMRAVIADTVPPPPTILAEPVRYVCAVGVHTVRSLRAGGQVVRFQRGVAEVTHGDAVEVLDQLALVRRA